MRWSVQAKIGGGFGVAIAMLAVAGLLSFQSTRDLISTLRDVAQGHAVTRSLEGVVSQIKAIESDTRGYVISGNPRILEGRQQALQDLPREIARLEELTREDQARHGRVAALLATVQPCLDWHERLLDAYRTSGRETAAAMVHSGRGTELMDAVEQAAEAARAEQILTIQARDAEARSGARATLVTVLATGLAASVVVAVALVLIVRDVKQRERAESALRQSEARLTAVLDNTDAIVYVKDLEGRYLLANRSFEKSLELPRERILGKTSADIVGDPGVSETLRANDRLALASETPLTFEERVPRHEGMRTFISVKCALRGPDGVAYGLCGISTDITDLKRAEAERVRLESFLDSIVENIPNMVFVKDARELRFVRFNRAGEELLGFTREDLLGKNDYDFFPKEEADFFTGKDREVLVRRELLDIPEEPIRTGSGETRYLHTKKVPIVDSAGVPQYLLGISEDVTERKHVAERVAALNEGLRRRTEELEASNQELEAFSYSVSHDLRAPLRHIAGFADLLERGAAGTLDERSLRYLDKISRSATRMGELIDDLLVFSRMGRSEMRHGPIELGSLVEEIVTEIREETKDRNIEWNIGLLPHVIGDRAMLRLALVNLISNAVKYTRPREVARIEIGAEQQNGGVVVFVRDNGVGFEGQYRHKLFGVFQRLHRPEEFEGTGIGLANVRRIVHRHGGTTWAEGEKDRGACFYFSLPVNGKEAA